MQQLPQLARAVQEKAHMFPEINDVVAHFILPYVLKFWMVKNNQVIIIVYDTTMLHLLITIYI